MTSAGHSRFRFRLENAAVPAAPDRGFGAIRGAPGVPMTDPQPDKQPSSGTNRPVPGIQAIGDCPGTLIPLAGRLQYQGRYLG